MDLIIYVICFCLIYQSVSCEKYVSDSELKSWSEEILKKDVNNLAGFVKLALQEKSKSNSSTDNAPLPLISIDENALRKPTVSSLLALYNNFIPETTIPEVVTNEEISEQHRFMDEIFKTELFSLVKQFLRSKDLIPKTDKEFKDFMYNLWFKLYSRGHRKLSSSAFEHIFMGEIKNGQISGFHNWLFFNYLEVKKNINYLGWVKKLDLPNQKGSLLKLHFSWGNHFKPIGSMFIGTSPELELSLYTICFLTRPNNKCHLSLGGKQFHIQTYTFNQNNQKIISSAYPLI